MGCYTWKRNSYATAAISCEIYTQFPIIQAYREGSYQAAFDLYTQLLDTSDPVRRVLG